MWKTRYLIITIIVAMILAPQAVAGDKFWLLVFDKNGNPASDVSIEIWNDGDRIDSGYTDSEGKYVSWLDSNIRYKITANRNEQTAEWEDYPNSNNHNIRIYMHERS